MGILNVTPDSFSDGGRYASVEAAISAAHAMAAHGASIVDIGAESTRPGSDPVWEGDEVARLKPVLEGLKGSGIVISADTRKASVMAMALNAGAHLVNDVSGLTHDPAAARVVAEAGCPVVLMHAQGDPKTMQDRPSYDDALLDIYDALAGRLDAAVAAGIKPENVILDPGIGFGKSLRHNLQVLNGLALLHGLGCPVLLGASRKRFIGALDREASVDERLGGSLAVLLKGLEQGVQILRVHDVKESVQAMRIWLGLRDEAVTPRISIS
jgi:dihydropteroate synthase